MRRLLLSAASVMVLTAAGHVLAAEPVSLNSKGDSPQNQGAAVSKREKEDLDEVLKLIEAAFRGAKLEKAPLSADQITNYTNRVTEREQATAGARVQEARMVATSKTISLEPNARREEVLVAAGYMTTVVFLDSTGQPWPIDSYGVGNSEAYDVPKPRDGDHTISIFLKRRYEPSNLTVQLAGLPTPVTLALKNGGETVNDRFDARIPAFGPKSKSPIVTGGDNLSAGDPILMTVLEGVPPDGAKRVDIAGGDPRTIGWVYQGAFYVRSPNQLLSPAWQGHVSAADGTTAYRIPGMVPVLVFSEDGQMVRLQVEARAGEKSNGRR